jgi:organic hydroperoxide reductase OsmC/OhrA
MSTDLSVAPRATAVAETHGFAFDVDLIDAYRQRVDFALPGVAPLDVDEPPPLGASGGPNPARLLGAAVASCLGASLLFCLGRARIAVRGLHTHVDVTMTRNARGRLRVGRIRVRLEPAVAEEDQPRVARCAEVFEEFCVVTASVRPGVPVDVDVVPVAPATVARGEGGGPPG